MKFASAFLAFFAVSTVQATKTGLRKIPSPRALGIPTEICTVVGDGPHRVEEFVVIQYNSSLNNMALIDSNYSDFIFDMDDIDDQFFLGDSFREAYKEAHESCDQVGARDEIYETDFLAHREDDSTFLLRVNRFSNSVAAKFSTISNDDCGPIIFNATDSSSVDFVLPLERRLGIGVDNTCSCTVPTAADVVVYYNKALEKEFDLTGFIIGTEQICEGVADFPSETNSTID